MKLKTIITALLIAVAAATASAAKPLAKHVVLIGFDGWGAYSYEKAEIPNIKRLADDGALTLQKRTVLPSSSAVNWASMFMGAGPELHGYTEWGSQTPELPSREISHYGIFPSVWGLLRDANPDAEIGYIYEWGGMKYLAEQEAMNFSSNVYVTDDNPRGCTDTAVNYIREKKPNLVGIIYDEPDGVGHSKGHDTPEYYAKLKVLDGYVGEIVQAVKDAGMLDETIFILSSDHGGINKGHGGKTMVEMETPLIISGKNVKRGHEISESVMQFDIAPTIAHIFRLETPQVWIGRPLKTVFTKK